MYPIRSNKKILFNYIIEKLTIKNVTNFKRKDDSDDQKKKNFLKENKSHKFQDNSMLKDKIKNKIK